MNFPDDTDDDFVVLKPKLRSMDNITICMRAIMFGKEGERMLFNYYSNRRILAVLTNNNVQLSVAGKIVTIIRPFIFGEQVSVLKIHLADSLR